MAINIPGKLRLFNCLKIVLFISVLLSACTIPRRYEYQNGKKKRIPFTRPFVFKNNIEVNGGNFTSDEKINLLQRLDGQLDDSSRTITTDAFFFIHKIDNPPAYDSGYTAVSAKNMKASMTHLGYYQAQVTDTAVTWKRKGLLKKTLGVFGSLYEHIFHKDWISYRREITYTVNAGNPTLIDTVGYNFNKPELERLALQTRPQSFLAKGKPVSKEIVLNEIGRLVELFRNNGYYKFTADDIRVIGDTTVAILTNVSDDPFENLSRIEEAKNKRDSPTIKLGLVINPASDTNRLKKFYINNVYIYPDYSSTDTLYKKQYQDSVTRKNKYIIRYHQNLFRTGFLVRNIYFKKGDEYNQENYVKTISSFSQSGVWQSVIVQIEEIGKNSKDSIGKIDIIIQLFPAKKFGFEANLEASFSTNSNTNTAIAATTGDLLGLSVNASLQNRNVHKEAIKMTHAINAGIELNLNSLNTNQRINSNDLGYTNTISFPHLIPPAKWFVSKKKRLVAQESFINTSISYVNRINLFKLQNFGLALGGKWSSSAHPNRTKVFKPLNIEFSYLYDQSQSFKDTLKNYPYLNYSFNTALVMGEAFSYSSFHKHENKLNEFKFNIEESGLIWGNFGLFKNYMRKFVKFDIENTYTITHQKSSIIFHFFGGWGIPIGKSDTTLPFFKQYYGGGANSMRGWPVRGIGIGGQPLTAYDPNAVYFNDKTGDIRLELNVEYRHDLFQIIPNSVSLKGALFFDIGNIWDSRNNQIGGGPDTLQFRWQNLWKQLGADMGAGLRFDFNYFLIRFDMGFRVKRPDVSEHDGWQFPDITFDHLFKRGVGDEDRKWRYENFNFSVGLNYPF